MQICYTRGVTRTWLQIWSNHTHTTPHHTTPHHTTPHHTTPHHTTPPNGLVWSRPCPTTSQYMEMEHPGHVLGGDIPPPLYCWGLEDYYYMLWISPFEFSIVATNSKQHAKRWFIHNCWHLANDAERVGNNLVSPPCGFELIPIGPISFLYILFVKKFVQIYRSTTIKLFTYRVYVHGLDRFSR